MNKFINFDAMITPTIIKILFWVGVGVSAISALITIFTGLAQMASPYGGSAMLGFFTVIIGFIVFALGVLFSRIYCELLIVIFKIQGTLTEINKKLDRD